MRSERTRREGIIGEPEQVGVVGRELRRLRMWFDAKEQVRELFAVVRRERGHVDQPLHALVLCEADAGAA